MHSLKLGLCWKFLIVIGLPYLNNTSSQAQVLQDGKKWVNDLCSPTLAGRGYVNNGVNKAADYLEKEIKAIGLKSIPGGYIQSFNFSVNTHPETITCTLDNQVLEIGRHFIVGAGSPTIKGQFNLLHFNPTDSLDSVLLFKKIALGFNTNEALVLHKANPRKINLVDSFEFYAHKPSLIIYTEEKKLTHTIATRLDEMPTVICLDSILQNKHQFTIDVKNEFIPSFVSRNVIGYVKGTEQKRKRKDDSCLVFSAHFDHLGKQGQAIFPGASDNASGVSMLLNLAKYFSKHRPKNDMYFIFFSGEEAGLLGSAFFTQHPTFDIRKARLVVNIDIMGDAENGITVVNGEVYKSVYDKLVALNQKQNGLKEVRIRGKAKNSDHYYFSEMGIPSIFIYSMGGPGYYHDIDDKPSHLTFKKYEEVYELLLNFAKEF